MSFSKTKRKEEYKNILPRSGGSLVLCVQTEAQLFSSQKRDPHREAGVNKHRR